MTDQTIPDVTDDDRRVARDWAEHIFKTPDTSLPMETAAARVILNDTPAPAHALPEGWRLADHKAHGRVIVTNELDEDGAAWFVYRADYLHSGFGHAWRKPAELTYLDTEPEEA